MLLLLLLQLWRWESDSCWMLCVFVLTVGIISSSAFAIRSECWVFSRCKVQSYTLRGCVHVNIFHLQKHKVVAVSLSTDNHFTYCLSRKFHASEFHTPQQQHQHRQRQQQWQQQQQHSTECEQRNCWLSVTPNPSVVLSSVRLQQSILNNVYESCCAPFRRSFVRSFNCSVTRNISRFGHKAKIAAKK